jgi:hypothetical protein
MAQSDFIVKNGAVILNGLTATSTSTTTGALVIQGGIGMSGDSTIGGIVNIINTTQSTSSTTGALLVSGGIGLYGDMNIGGGLFVRGVDLMKAAGEVIHVSEIGDDDNDGLRLQSAVRTIKRGLELAAEIGPGVSVEIAPGTYEEEFPLIVSTGTAVKGAGLRQTTVRPTTATNTQTAFLLNGETTISDFAVTGFFKPGYAFAFAPGAKITTRSPYVQRFTVLTYGSNPQPGDPYGYDSNDAGGGAYLDGSQVDSSSLEAAFLFNEATFITPSSNAIYITNGTRVELLNGFSYFADKGIEAKSGDTGWGGTGRTRLRLVNTTGTFAQGQNLYYISSTGTVLASGLIDEVTDEYVYLDGKASGFEEAQDRAGKTVNVYGTTELSSFQRKIGTASVHFINDGDLLDVVSDADLQYGFSSYTLEAYVFLEQGGQKQQIFDKGSTPATEFGIYVGSDNKVVGQHSTNLFTSTSVLSTGTWYHILMSRDTASTNRLFINGVLEAVTTSSATINNNDSLTFGGVAGDPSLSLKGYMDEIRVSTVARYTENFVPPTVSYNSDAATTILIHGDGADGSIDIRDDGQGSQTVYATTGSYTATIVASAQQISLADYRQFGGELRSIGSAICYGNYGIYADGEGVDLKAIAFNMSFIGAGKDLTNDPTLTIQENEIVALNKAKVYYQTVDQNGDFRVGPQFRINQRTGNVDFGTANFRLGPLSSLTISDGVNSAVLQPTSIQVGALLFGGNTIQTISGNLTINPSGSLTTIESNLQVNGGINFTGQIKATSVENAISTTTGALVVDGGIGLAKDIWVGGNATVVGNLTVKGSTTVVNSTVTSISDPVLELGSGPDGNPVLVNDGQDRGLLFNYNTSETPGLETFKRTFLGMDGGDEKLIYKVGVSEGTADTLFSDFENTGTWGSVKFGSLELVDTTTSFNTYTGALIVAGGAGFGESVYAKEFWNQDGLVISTGTVSIYAITNLSGGDDIEVTSPQGTSVINNLSTLQSVTSRGSSTNHQIILTNTDISTGTNSGALIVTGGVGLGGNLNVGGDANIGGTITAGDIISNGSLVVTEGTLGDLGVTAVYAGTDTAVNTNTGLVVVWSTSTLQTVTDRGYVTTNRIVIDNTLTSVSTFTEQALVVTGGIGSFYILANEIYDDSKRVVTEVYPFAGTGISISDIVNTGTNVRFTVNNEGVIAINGSNFIGVNTFTGEVIITNLGVQTLSSSDGDIAVSTSTGTVVITNSSTLQSVTNRGFTTTNAIRIENATQSIDTISGALTVVGGVGIQGSLHAGDIFSNGSQVLTNASLGDYGVTSLTPGSGISVNTTTGAVTIESIDTLDLVAGRGNSSSYAISIFNDTEYTDTGTGAFYVTGGVGIEKNLVVNELSTLFDATITNSLKSAGIVSIYDETESENTKSGALVVTGGVGIGKNLTVGGNIVSTGTIYGSELYDSENRVITSVTAIGGFGIAIRNPETTGPGAEFTIDNTGVLALVDTPYIGISSATGIVTITNLGVQTLTAGTDTAVSRSTGTVVVWNTSTLQSVTDRGSTTSNRLHITNTETAISKSSGALVVDGGVGIGKDLVVGGNASIYGNLTIVSTGTQVVINSTQTYIVDPVIEIGGGIDNTLLSVNDGFDRGIVFNYNPSAVPNSSLSTHAFIGLDNQSKELIFKTGAYTGTTEFPPDFASEGAWGRARFGGLNLVNGTSSTNTTSGDLIVEGGAGIGGNLYVGDIIYSRGLEVLTTSSLGSGGVGVSQIFAGTDTAVSGNFGIVEVWNTSTFQTVTERGSITNQQITINNSTPASSTETGALVVSGGIGVANIRANVATIDTVFGGNLFDSSNRVVTSVIPYAGPYIGISNLIFSGPAVAFTITNLGVHTLTAGTDTVVSSSTGSVSIWNNSTLQTVTDRGSDTTNEISILNTTESDGIDSGALIVSGGAGIGGNLHIGGSTVLGSGATTRNIKNADVRAGGSFLVDGDAQAGSYILRGLINSTNLTTLTTNGQLPVDATNQITMPNFSSYTFKVLVTAKSTTSNNEGAWEFNGSIARYGGAPTTVLRVVNKTKIWSSIAGYDVIISADNTLGCLRIQAKGANTDTVRFVARVDTVEVST